MKHIIFDLEFNSAFKINKRTKQLMKGNTNPLCPQEIIEIGAVKTNDQIEVEDTFTIFIKPQLYNKIHPKVKKKTGITEGDLGGGVAIETAINDFKNWIGEEEYILCSWGRDDIHELKRNCQFFKLGIEWIKETLDIQKTCMKHLKSPKGQQIGLKHTVEALNIEMKYPFHKALNDAIYTAEILKKLNDMSDDEI